MVKIHSQDTVGRVPLADATRGAADPSDRGRQLRQQEWRAQQAMGCELITVGDLGWEERVLTHSRLVGLDAQAYVAGEGGFAGPVVCQAPVFAPDQAFALGSTQLFEEVAEARSLGLAVKPVLLGPLSYLWLGRSLDPACDRLELLESLLPVYGEIFARLAALGVEWVQLDEPLLSLELPLAWRTAFERAYNLLQREPLKKLLGVRPGELLDNLGLAAGLPVEGLHVDWPRTVQTQQGLLDRLPAYKMLSLGLVEAGESDEASQQRRLHFARQAGERLGARLWLSPADLSAVATTAQATALSAEFTLLARTARDAAQVKPAATTERPWSAIEAALTRLGNARSGLVPS